MKNNDDILHEDKMERPTTYLMRKHIMATLMRHYPHMSVWPMRVSGMGDHSPWLIDIKDFSTGGVVTIRNLMLSGKMGMQLPLKKIQEDANGSYLVSQVGELLERYKISREKGLDMREAILEMPRNWRGDAIGDRG